MTTPDNLKIFQDVIQQEADALNRVKSLMKKGSVDKMIEIFEYLKSTNSELIVSGIGKSGIIAQKMVSTFNSIGL